MNQAGPIGIVVPRYGTLRRALLPIYGVDQLVFVAVVVLPFVCLGWVNPKLALFTGVGAYAGFVGSMRRSTPSSLLLPAIDEPRIAAMLDRSPFFESRGDGQRNSTKGRLKRWDSDNIRVARNGETIRIEGRQIDLQKFVFLLGG
jgi:hypothetical protein